jgi:Plant transposon protein
VDPSIVCTFVGINVRGKLLMIAKGRKGIRPSLMRLSSHTIEGWYGATNDQTISRYDKYVKRVEEDPFFTEASFKIFDKDGYEFELQGSYIISDGGYVKSGTFVDPFSFRSDMSYIYWSEWVESVRKDVECTFGILKGRFRLLKNATKQAQRRSLCF